LLLALISRSQNLDFWSATKLGTWLLAESADILPTMERMSEKFDLANLFAKIRSFVHL
jgi:hypothetical protein